MYGESLYPKDKRLLVVSNRLPVTVKKAKGKYTLHPASGGLITALAPLLRKLGGAWIGWLGGYNFPQEEIEKLLEEFHQRQGFRLIPVHLEQEDVHLYYQGFSNEILWPLFHDLHNHCRFKPEYWSAYQRVNRKFCETVEENTHTDELIWVHDYHLIKVAEELALPSPNTHTAFFLHTPFSPPDIFVKIPWRKELLQAFLAYDHIGFQTKRDTRNFLYCVQALLPDAKICSNSTDHAKVTHNQRRLHVGTYPISIDYEEFATQAKEREVTEKTHAIAEALANRQLVLSVDRLDMTKGITYRLEAIRYFLQHYPKWREKITFVQVVVPSRTDVWKYLHLKEKIDKLVSEINAEFTTSGWVPIHYLFQSLTRQELLAYYRATSVMWITPIKDGMNLVSKEFPASKKDAIPGVLILSEFAGSAFQLSKGALLVNPYDIEGMAHTLKEALVMPEEEKSKRLETLQKEVRSHDIYQWIEEIFCDTVNKQFQQMEI